MYVCVSVCVYVWMCLYKVSMTLFLCASATRQHISRMQLTYYHNISLFQRSANVLLVHCCNNHFGKGSSYGYNLANWDPALRGIVLQKNLVFLLQPHRGCFLLAKGSQLLKQWEYAKVADLTSRWKLDFLRNEFCNGAFDFTDF